MAYISGKLVGGWHEKGFFNNIGSEKSVCILSFVDTLAWRIFLGSWLEAGMKKAF